MSSSSDPALIDALELLPLYADEAILEPVRDIHRAVAGRVFGLVNRTTGNAGSLPQAVHDGIAATVYLSVGVGLKGGRRALRAGRGRGPRLTTPLGRTATSSANGFFGDRLVAEGFPIAIGTTVRLRGEDVPVDPAHLTAAFPQASRRIAVLVHGLAEHDQFWQYRRDEVGSTYPELLEHLGWTPVVLRYNSGLSLRENGVALAVLLQDLVAAWPADVDRIALIGHSMGGLVAHAACAVATPEAGRRPWLDRLTDVITLGAPHLGADLARLTRVGSRLLALVPETRGLATLLDARSVGIDDLSDGLPDLAPVEGVRYRLVAATLGASRWHPLGDLLVRVPSAYGRTPLRDLFPGADVVHLPRTDHFGLLNHPELHTALKGWLA